MDDELSEVYLKILFTKNGQFINEDILDDDDIMNDMIHIEKNGITYIDKDERILFVNGEYEYINTFKKSIEYDALYKTLKLKCIDKVYYVYYEISEKINKIQFAIIEWDIKNNKIPKNYILEEKSYEEEWEKYFYSKDLLIADDREFYDEDIEEARMKMIVDSLENFKEFYSSGEKFIFDNLK